MILEAVSAIALRSSVLSSGLGPKARLNFSSPLRWDGSLLKGSWGIVWENA